MVPAIGAAAMSGFVLGIGTMLPIAKRRSQHLYLFGIMSLVLVGLFSGFHPFGIGLEDTYHTARNHAHCLGMFVSHIITFGLFGLRSRF